MLTSGSFVQWATQGALQSVEALKREKHLRSDDGEHGRRARQTEARDNCCGLPEGTSNGDRMAAQNGGQFPETLGDSSTDHGLEFKSGPMRNARNSDDLTVNLDCYSQVSGQNGGQFIRAQRLRFTADLGEFLLPDSIACALLTAGKAWTQDRSLV